MKEAVLLLAHGTPDVLGEMAEYLSKVTGGRALPQEVVEELQHRYGEIGLGWELGEEPPPLTKWTLTQGFLLEKALGTKVYVGMRNWHPYIAEVVDEMRADGVTRIKALCLAPQNSRTSVGLYRRVLMDAAVGMEVEFVTGWAEQPLLAQAFAEKTWPVWAQACAEAGRRVPVLFTAHSVPCRTIMTGAASIAGARPGTPVQATPDPYPVEAKRTAQLVAEKLSVVGFTEQDWVFAFQSQGISGGPWIGPTVEDTLKALKEQGEVGVVMQPVGFLCDHVEILYDIDIAFRKTAEDLGLKLWRAESLNDSATLVEALVEVVTGRYQADVDEVVVA
ncbi:ferrochelatase [Granulicella sibirica]|uniref:Ferrochelatase n=1 Tax=Granulicella sibirica TaxID=2479048 RepID=A0A4V1L535_9BACT|nr:ferrochelatase [Granulicella sibirica]RXH54384.1 Ferrochelatase, protoheme ferro-lyase [Granulicella sibirica]